MSVKRLVLIVLIGIISVGIAVTAVILIADAAHDTAKVSIADAVEVPETTSAVVEVSPEMTVSVSASNVQNVIRTMSRMTTFSRTVTVTSYWDGGSSTSNITVRADGDNTAYVINGKREKHILRAGNTLYLWYGGSGDVFTSEISENTISDDELQSLVTWEKIVELPTENIKTASYSTLNGSRCIYVEYISGELGFRTECYVSVDSGLVLSANTYDGETLIYAMTSTEANFDPVAESYFDLPDGSNALNRS